MALSFVLDNWRKLVSHYSTKKIQFPLSCRRAVRAKPQAPMPGIQVEEKWCYRSMSSKHVVSCFSVKAVSLTCVCLLLEMLGFFSWRLVENVQAIAYSLAAFSKLFHNCPCFLCVRLFNNIPTCGPVHQPHKSTITRNRLSQIHIKAPIKQSVFQQPRAAFCICFQWEWSVLLTTVALLSAWQFLPWTPSAEKTSTQKNTWHHLTPQQNNVSWLPSKNNKTATGLIGASSTRKAVQCTSHFKTSNLLCPIAA